MLCPTFRIALSIQQWKVIGVFLIKFTGRPIACFLHAYSEMITSAGKLNLAYNNHL